MAANESVLVKSKEKGSQRSMDVMIVGGDECRAAVVVFWGSEMDSELNEAERERRLSTALDNLEPMFQ